MTFLDFDPFFEFQQGDVDTYMKDFLHYGMTNRTHSTEIEVVLREIEEMKVTEKYVIYNYDTMYSSPWAPHIDYEQRHRIITEVNFSIRFLTASMSLHGPRSQ